VNPARVADLGELEARFERAFRTGVDTDLEVVGYGEITSVVAWHGPDGPVAAKRLPTFRGGLGVDDYVAVLNDYLDALRGSGVDVVPTTPERIALGDGDVALYLVQPRIDHSFLGHSYLQNASVDDAIDLFDRVFDLIESVIGSGIGFDAQISNWALLDGSIVYFDVTTPLLRDHQGQDRLDTGIFLASLPWLLRGFVRRFMVRGIIDEYFDVRTTILNLLAQFHKERLIHLLPAGVEAANCRLDEPLTIDEVDRYYAKDARLWEFLQRLRRVDRWWHLRVRRRPYPFLLPGRIDR